MVALITLTCTPVFINHWYCPDYSEAVCQCGRGVHAKFTWLVKELTCASVHLWKTPKSSKTVTLAFRGFGSYSWTQKAPSNLCFEARWHARIRGNLKAKFYYNFLLWLLLKELLSEEFLEFHTCPLGDGALSYGLVDGQDLGTLQQFSELCFHGQNVESSGKIW